MIKSKHKIIFAKPYIMGWGSISMQIWTFYSPPWKLQGNQVEKAICKELNEMSRSTYKSHVCLLVEVILQYYFPRIK